MSVPAPTSQLLKYADDVEVNVAPQQVNLVDLDSYGHRISVTLLTSVMNAAFSWSRAVGSARPVGHFNSSPAFTAAIVAALNNNYTDTDAVSGKLSFDSAALNSNIDPRIREGGNVSANDLIMAYVLYKVYGSSAASTSDKVFNLQDAYGMLESSDLAAALVNSFSNAESQTSAAGNEKGAVDAMFRDLLAADSLRFFDASGNQVPGLFETNADAAGSGSWNLVDGDKMEVRTIFTFLNSVTLRASTDVAQNLNPLPSQANDETVFIEAGSKLYVRLQLTASDSGSSGGSATAPSAPTNLQLTAGDTQISATWGAPENDGSSPSTVYIVYLDGNRIASTIFAEPFYTFTGLTNGTSYNVSISAFNTIEGVTCSAVSATPAPVPTAPATPANVAVTGADAQIIISWDAPTDTSITSYIIYTNGWGPITVAAPATSYTLGATNGTTYTGFYVTAVNAAGESAPSATFSATANPTSVPATPTGLNAVFNASVVIITWEAPSGPSVQGYNIYLNGTLYSSIAPTAYFQIPNLVPGLTYDLTLTATNTIGESDPTTAISLAPENLPVSPSGVSIIPYNSRVFVSWQATVQTLSAYKVYFSTTGVYTSPVATVSGTTLSTDIDLTGIAGFADGVLYGIVITAVNANGLESARNPQASFTATTSSLPSPPRILTATSSNNAINVTWSAPMYAGATPPILSYNLYVEDTTTASITTITGVTGLSATIPSLTNGTNYGVYVTAVSADGESNSLNSYNTILTGTLYARPGTIPGNPENIAITSGDGSFVTTWTHPSYTGASGGSILNYNVYVGTDAGMNAPVSVSASSTSYTATGLTNGANYYIRVSAVSSDGESYDDGYQNSVRVNVLPAAPTDLSVVGIDSALAIAWRPSTANAAAIDNYNLYINGNFVTNTINFPLRSTMIRALTNGTSYDVTISAVNNIGESPQTSVTAGTPGAAAPGPVTVGGVLATFVGAVPSTLTLGANVTEISPTAFINPITGAGPTNLASIDLSSTNIVVLPNNIFSGFSGLTSVTIPPTLTSIGSQTFNGCANLSIIDLSTSSVQTIGPEAFQGCLALTSIILPASLTSINFGGRNTFQGCSNLQFVDFSATAITFLDGIFNGCTSLTSVLLPSGLLALGGAVFNGCSALTSVAIPSGVTSIGASAFNSCSSLSSLTLPSGLLSLGDSVFNACSSLTSMVIPSGIRSIGLNTFLGCTALISVTIPSGVTSIGQSAFNGTAITSVTLPAGLLAMGNNAFRNCASLTSVVIPDSITFLEEAVFHSCASLTSISIPSTVTDVASAVFAGCNTLTSINLPAGLLNISANMFTGCNILTSIVIPNGVTVIGTGAFYNCYALSSVSIPSGVIRINSLAFGACTSLVSIILPDSLTLIESEAFFDCISLTSITIPASFDLTTWMANLAAAGYTGTIVQA